MGIPNDKATEITTQVPADGPAVRKRKRPAYVDTQAAANIARGLRLKRSAFGTLSLRKAQAYLAHIKKAHAASSCKCISKRAKKGSLSGLGQVEKRRAVLCRIFDNHSIDEFVAGSTQFEPVT